MIKLVRQMVAQFLSSNNKLQINGLSFDLIYDTKGKDVLEILVYDSV